MSAVWSISAETRRIRVLLFRMVLEILRAIHKAVMPGRKLAADLQKMMVLGATTSSHAEGKPTTANEISKYIEMPRETTRRTLNQLERDGFVERTDKTHYVPTEEKTQGNHEVEAATIVQHTSEKLK